MFNIWLNKYLLQEHLCHPVAATRWHSGQKYSKFNIRIVNSNDPLESILMLSYVFRIFSTRVLFVCSVFSFPVIPSAHHSLSLTHTKTHWIKLKIVRKHLPMLATQTPRSAGRCGSKSMASRVPGLSTKWRHHICNNRPTKESVEKMNACVILSCLPLVLRFFKTNFSQEPVT